VDIADRDRNLHDFSLMAAGIGGGTQRLRCAAALVDGHVKLQGWNRRATRRPASGVSERFALKAASNDLRMTTLTASPHRLAQYWALTKPRVTQLAVFCAVIGMFLSTSELPSWRIVVAATVGIWLLAGGAFAINCLVEREIDARMARTARRPMARGELSVIETLIFAGLIGGAGMWVLYNFVNALTMWLTFATFIGYAIIYTMILKPTTPQNIVIGGLSGAMPPALGWAAIANEVPMQAWILVLIIFVWT